MRSLLLTLAMLTTFSLHAQTGESAWSYVDYEPHSDYRRLEVLNDSMFVALGTVGLCNRYSLLSVFGKNGNQLWQLQTEPCASAAAADVLVDDKGQLLVTGYSHPYSLVADCISNQTVNGYYLQKWSPDGELTFSRIFPTNDFPDPPQLAQLPGGDYLLWEGTKMFQIQEDGTFVDSTEVSIRNVLDLQLKADSNLILTYPDHLEILDSNFQVLEKWQAQEELIGSFVHGDSIWVLSEQAVYIFSESQMMDPIKLELPEGFMPTGLAKSNDIPGITIFGRESEAFSVYSLMGKAYQKWDIKLDRSTKPQYALHTKDQFFIAGNERFLKDPSYSPLELGVISSRSTFLSDTIPAAQDVSLEARELTYEYPPNPNFEIRDYDTDEIIGFIYVIAIDVDVELFNYGTDTLQEILIFSQSTGQSNCSESRMVQKLENLNLSPGKSTKTSIQISDNVYKSISEPVGHYDYCFFIAGPDHQIDPIINNNSSCLKAVITNTQEPYRPNLTPQIRLSPNPATGQVKVRLDGKDPIRSLILLNHAGQQMPVSYELLGQSAILQRGHLPPGLYYVRVQTETGWGVRKLVWQ